MTQTPITTPSNAGALHPVLEIKDLTVSYGKVEALTNASLTVGEGQIVTVIGPNGAGKTTMLSAIMGVLGSKGEVSFDGTLEIVPEVEHMVARGMTLVPPYDHADVIAGQGTAAKELIEEVGELDTLFVCLGGGGLLAGSALAARALSPDCKVIGVEPLAGNDGQQSLRSGEIVHIDTPRTIADGAQTQHLGQLTFEIIRRDVADILTATDDQLVEAMRFYAERMKLLVEPTGCLSYAGACYGGLPLRGQRVGIIISGGNVDLSRFATLTTDIASHLTSAGSVPPPAPPQP